MNQIPYVSIIIPCFERANELERLLISLKNLDFPEPYEIIVVDDGSKNEQAIRIVIDKFLASKKDNLQCSLIRLDDNLGPAQARNIGVKKAKGKFLWFLDSDSQVHNPDLLTKLVQSLKQNKSLVGVGGEAMTINEKLYAPIPYHFPNWFFVIKYIPIDKPFKAYPKCIGANNLLIAKKDFLATRGFSPYLDIYEDNDLCLQLTRSGRSLMIGDDTCLIHYHTASGRAGGKFSFFNKMWSYVVISHFNRVKLLFLNFPHQLLILPLLDILFAPVVLCFQIFFIRRRPHELLSQKSKKANQSFVSFILFNLIAMFLAWLMAYLLIIKSLIIGREAIIKK